MKPIKAKPTTGKVLAAAHARSPRQPVITAEELSRSLKVGGYASSVGNIHPTRSEALRENVEMALAQYLLTFYNPVGSFDVPACAKKMIADATELEIFFGRIGDDILEEHDTDDEEEKEEDEDDEDEDDCDYDEEEEEEDDSYTEKKKK